MHPGARRATHAAHTAQTRRHAARHVTRERVAQKFRLQVYVTKYGLAKRNCYIYVYMWHFRVYERARGWSPSTFSPPPRTPVLNKVVHDTRRQRKPSEPLLDQLQGERRAVRRTQADVVHLSRVAAEGDGLEAARRLAAQRDAPCRLPAAVGGEREHRVRGGRGRRRELDARHAGTGPQRDCRLEDGRAVHLVCARAMA